MDREIIRLIRKDIRLPTLPAIALKILSAVNNEDSALAELGEIIAMDPALSAKMLRVANSGLYNCGREVSDLKRAMSVLGTTTIKCLALSFVISRELSRNNDTSYDLDDFWRNSVTTAVAAELLGQKINCSNKELFLLGLLQNLGMLVILLSKGEEYQQLLESVEEEDVALPELEQKQFGFDHLQVVNLLFTNWNFPEEISQPIFYHHCPKQAPDDFRESAEVLALAWQLAEVYIGNEGAEQARRVRDVLIEDYGLNEDAVLELLDEAAEQSCEIISVFDIPSRELRPYSKLLEEANEALEQLNLDSSQLILELQQSKDRNLGLIRKLRETNHRLKEMANRDSLTGLYNHRFFQESLSRELSRALRHRSSLSLVIFDIDNFKQINDAHGYQIGDHVLQNIAQSVGLTIRASDTFARFGGDEFAVILPATNKGGARTFAEHLRVSVEGVTTPVNGSWTSATVSVGVATYRPGDKLDNHEQLLRAADQALYRSKQQGKNQVRIGIVEEKLV